MTDRTEAAAKALHESVEADFVDRGKRLKWENDLVDHDLYRREAAVALAAADAAALADEALHARITAWVGRTYTADKPTVGQVRMVLAALTALSKEQT
jgi:hypothetical protein